jgi:hypothetical protein
MYYLSVPVIATLISVFRPAITPAAVRAVYKLDDLQMKSDWHSGTHVRRRNCNPHT